MCDMTHLTFFFFEGSHKWKNCNMTKLSSLTLFLILRVSYVQKMMAAYGIIHMCGMTHLSFFVLKGRINGIHDSIEFVYGVATISRLLKMTGLFCKRGLEKRRYSAKETYHFKEPTDRSHPI